MQFIDLKAQYAALKTEIDANIQTVIAEGKRIPPFVQDNCMSAYSQYVVLAKDTAQCDNIVAHLTDKQIPNMIYYPFLQHVLPVFEHEPHYGETYENALNYCARTFSLPMHPYLDKQTQQQIIDAVLEVL